MNERKLAQRYIAQNRKARFEYHLEDIIEAGIVLHGSEVKSLRDSNGNINDAYAEERNGELFLVNSYIAEYKGANRFNHEPRRFRKVLLHRRQINKMIGKVRTKGYTIIPVSMYFNEHNKVKIELALAKGKKNYDKRETEKERDWNRNKARIIRDE